MAIFPEAESEDTKRDKRPNAKTLRAVVAWLEAQGLEIVGPTIFKDEDGRLIPSENGRTNYDITMILLLAEARARHRHLMMKRLRDVVTVPGGDKP